MSWLGDRTIRYRYKLSDGSIHHMELPADQEPPETIEVEDGQVAVYAGFEPDKIQQTHSVEYDQNGRKAVRVRQGDGSVRHISKTKLHYLKTGRVEHQYTKSYREHLEKTKQEQLLATEHNKKRAKVSQARPQDTLKNLPDGEYVSDGKNFMPASKK